MARRRANSAKIDPALFHRNASSVTLTDDVIAAYVCLSCVQKAVLGLAYISARQSCGNSSRFYRTVSLQRTHYPSGVSSC